MVMEPIIARWSDWNATGFEHLVLAHGSAAITADGIVLSGGDQLFAARYRVTCDLAWRVRSAEVELIGSPGRLQLSADGQGHWLDASANPLPELDGAIDIDLSISPFTNTLPIRRLDLQSGQSVDIVAAYIRVPELTVTRDPQRYICRQRRAQFRYESLDSDFASDIETDQDGLVVTYAGLFRRIH
jgi:hypothetical protein